MNGTPPRGRGWADTWKAPALVAVAAAIVFLPSLFGGFVWDDHRFIAENPSVVHPTSWLHLLTDANTVDTLGAFGIVRPLRTIEFAFDYALFGDSPFAFHVHSLLWHVAASALLCVLLRRLLGHGGAAVVAALFWAVNPTQSECVDFVSSRGDLAMGACVFASMIFALKSQGWDRFLAASLATAFVAMLYKEAAVALPAVILALRLTKLSRVPWWPHFLVLAAYMGYRACVQTSATQQMPFDIGGSRLGTIATAVRAFGYYLVQPLLPAESLEWYMSPSTSFADAAVLAWLAVHAALVASAVAARRGAPLWTVAVVWFYAFLGPVSNVVTSVGMPTCERFLYVSVGGVALALGLVLTRAPRGAWAATIVALAALAAGSVHRTRMWKSDDALWAEVVPDHDSSRGNNYVAFGLREQAFALFEAAAKKPEGAERAAAIARADALLEQALGLVHRSIAQRYELEVRPRSVAEITRYSETLASEMCTLLRRPEEALFHADMASSVAGGPDEQPQFLDDVAEFDRAPPLLALGFPREAATAARRALKFGLRNRADEVGALLLAAAVACEKDGMPAAAETCYVDAVAALKDGAAREDARSLLYELRRRPRPADVEATERSRIAASEERFKRLKPRCPELTHPPAPK